MVSQKAAMRCAVHRLGEGPAGRTVVIQQGLVVGQHGAHVGEAARESAWTNRIPSILRYGGWRHRRRYAQIAKKPVDVEQRAPVRVAHARDGAVGVRAQERDGTHGGRCHERACGTGVAAERRVHLAPAVRVGGKKGMQHRRRIELRAE